MIRVSVRPPLRSPMRGQLSLAEPAPTTATKLEGFRYFWAKYVRGFDPAHHCAKCLVGDWSKHTRMGMALPVEFGFDESKDFRFVYICGVSSIGYQSNLHIVLEPEDDASCSVKAFNGTVFDIQGARRLLIPPLPDGWQGKDRKYTTCRNFQFGVAYFGEKAFRADTNGKPWSWRENGPVAR